MSTIKDVAKHAGVSVSTVSNFLNQKGNLSDAKYKKIALAIKELNYTPNLAARTMRKSNLKVVAIVLPSLDTFYSRLYEGVFSILDPQGYQILIKISDDNIHKEKKILQELTVLGVVGILTVPVAPEDPHQYELLQDKKIPTIFVQRKSPTLQFSSATINSFDTVKSLILLKLKEKQADRISLIIGKSHLSNEMECLQAFQEAYVTATGAKASSHQILECSALSDFSFQSVFDYLIQMSEPPKVLFVSSKTVAAVALKALKLLMIEDCEIISLSADRWDTSLQLNASIGEVYQESLALGVTSGELLLEYLENPMVFESRNIVVENPLPQQDPPFKITQVKKILNILMLKSESSDAIVRLSQGYSRKSGYELKFHMKDYVELQRETEKSLGSASSEYDLVMADLPWISSFIEKGWLAELSPYFEGNLPLGNYHSKILKAFSLEKNALYGLPIVGTIQFLFYRKDLFENPDIQWEFLKKYGFALRPPINWTEFNIIAEFFNRSENSSSPVEYGTALNSIAPTGMIDEFLPRHWSYNGHIVDSNGNFVFDSAENIMAIENMKKSYEISYKSDEPLWWDDQFKLLLEGKVAMVMGFASHFPTDADARAGSEHYNNIGVYPVPGDKPMLGGWILGINKRSLALEESFQFLRWITDNKHAIPCLLLGGAMPNIWGYENARVKLHFPWFTDMKAGFSSSQTRERTVGKNGTIIDPFRVDTIIAEALKKVIEDDIPIHEALSEIKKELYIKG